VSRLVKRNNPQSKSVSQIRWTENSSVKISLQVWWMDQSILKTRGGIRCLGGVRIPCRPVTPSVSPINKEVNESQPWYSESPPLKYFGEEGSIFYNDNILNPLLLTMENKRRLMFHNHNRGRNPRRGRESEALPIGNTYIHVKMGQYYKKSLSINIFFHLDNFNKS
jgi:hypothetical protein